MSRIRSIHPGIYTDEAWASVSIAARWFAKGLCTEADDNGTFEWKPLQLKMRIFPADAVDVPALLTELTGAGIVMAFTADGKSLGSIKNFCRYQRPRKPKSWFPTTPQSLLFAAVGTPGSPDDDGEPSPVPQKSELPTIEAATVPPKSEKSPQMKEEGGRGKKEQDANASSVAAGDDASGFEALWRAYPHVKGRSSKPKALAAYAVTPKLILPRLVQAARHYGASGALPQSGAPALAKWLDEQRYLDWIGVDATPRPAWNGPADLRAAFVLAMNEDWVASYIDPSTWQDVPERTITPHNGIAAQRILEAKPACAVLTEFGVALVRRAA